MEASPETRKARYSMILESYTEIDGDVKAAALRLLESTIPLKSERFDGPPHQTLIKGLYIAENGRLKFMARRKTAMEKFEVKLELEDVPPIIVNTTGEMVLDCKTLEGLKRMRRHMKNQVFETIKHAPKETHDSYKRAYWKAKEEHQTKIRNKSAAVEDDAPHETEVQTEEFRQLIRDVRLRATQIGIDEMMTAAEINAEKLRAAYKDAVSAQIKARKMITMSQIKAEKLNKAYTNIVSGQVDVLPIQLPSIVFNAKAPSQEALEIHIGNQLTYKKLKAEQALQYAPIRSEALINFDRLARAGKRKSSSYIGKDEVERLEVFLGFKEQDTTDA